MLKKILPLPAANTQKLFEQQRCLIEDVIKRLERLDGKPSKVVQAVRMKFCPICKTESKRFKSRSAVGKKTRCPNCLSFERHRQLYLYLDKEMGLFSANVNPPIKLLHFAPEKCLFVRFKENKNIDYYPVDINPDHQRIRAIVDAQKIPYENDKFDIVISMHVLEHVPNDAAAIEEMFRVIKPGGEALVSVPDDRKLEATLEDSGFNTPELRALHYGQDDHLRKYGRDFPERLSKAGFCVSALKLAKHYSKKELEKYVANTSKSIWKCGKKRP